MKRCLFSIIITALIVCSTFLSAQEPSPTGDGWLELSEGSRFFYAPHTCSLGEEFNELTVEAWIYPKNLPKEGEYQVILDKQRSYSLKIHTRTIKTRSHSVLIGMLGAGSKAQVLMMSLPQPWLNKWHHVGIMYKSGAFYAMFVDGRLYRIDGNAAQMKISNRPLYVGGAKDSKSLSFDGLIDELRISDVVRYKNSHDAFDLPKKPFEIDKNTRALWHFNESRNASSFKDSTKHGNTLKCEKNSLSSKTDDNR